MDVESSGAQLRASGVPEILGEVIDLSFRCLGRLLLLFALLQAPVFSAGLILGFMSMREAFAVVVVIYCLLVGPLLVGSGIFVASNRLRGTISTLSDALKAAFRSQWDFLVLWLLSMGVLLACMAPWVLAGRVLEGSAKRTFPPVASPMTATDAASPLLFLCGVVAALWLISVFAPAVPALFLEGLEVATALRRGRELSPGRRWRILGVVLGLLTAVFFLYFVVGLTRAVLAHGGFNAPLFVFGVLLFVRGGLSYVFFPLAVSASIRSWSSIRAASLRQDWWKMGQEAE